MNFLSHFIVALLLSLALIIGYIYFYNPEIDLEFITLSVSFVIIAVISSSVPDLDQPSSTFFRVMEIVAVSIIAFLSVYFFGWTYKALSLAFGAFLVFRIVSSIIIPKHRGFIHSIVFMSILAIPIFIYSESVVITSAYMLGFWSHLLSDSIPFKIF